VSEYVLACKPAVGSFAVHDPSAVLFENGDPVFGGEEERFSRQKHATGTSPASATRACLDHCDITLSEVDEVVLPSDPRLKNLSPFDRALVLTVDGHGEYDATALTPRCPVPPSAPRRSSPPISPRCGT
jgi:predicted NodU family carbamoyl transferase